MFLGFSWFFRLSGGNVMRLFRPSYVLVVLLPIAVAACSPRAATTGAGNAGRSSTGNNPVESDSTESGWGKPWTEKDWRDFAIPRVNAMVQLPGPSAKNEYPSEEDGVAYISSGGEPHSEVNVIVFTPTIVEGQSVEQALDAYAHRKVGTDGVILEGINIAGLPSRGYVVKSGDKPVWEDRLIAIGKKWVILRANDPQGDKAMNKRFFESFKVTR
jgi:hypothetical protein